MYAWGFAYGGETGMSGFRPETPVETLTEVRNHLKTKLAGKVVTFIESDGKFRAYADGVRTGWLYFAVKKETWIAVAEGNLGTKGEKAVIGKGSLETVKKKVRDILDANGMIAAISFTRTGDNVKVYVRQTGNTYVTPEDITLIRVS